MLVHFPLFPLRPSLCTGLFSFTSLSVHCHYDCEFFHGLSFSSRSVSGLDKEPDLVHMEAHTQDGSECPTHTYTPKRSNEQVSAGMNSSWRKEGVCGETALPAPPINPVHDSPLRWPFSSFLSLSECQLYNSEWQYQQLLT